MNPKLVFTLWSFRKELKYVLLAFLAVLILPVVAVILLTQVGINVVSDKLVEQNSITQTIEIKDPTTGEVVKDINPTVVWPTKGVITLEFGETSLYQVFHTGIDIAGKLDDPVNPAMDGKVIYAGEIFWGFGKHVIIDNGNNVTTIYAHLDKIYVYPGQKVTTDTIIGGQGQTGWATGVHLHFQTNVYGIPVNPRVFLDNKTTSNSTTN
jgi:murein DD-endopeptidase MepM/ murein hydrolase activator NlpD